MESLIALVLGAAAGGIIAWFLSAALTRSRLETVVRESDGRARAAESACEELRSQLEPLTQHSETLQRELRMAEAARAAADGRVAEMERGLEQQKELLELARNRLTETFKSLAADALRSSSENFLTLASERLTSLQKEAALDMTARQRTIEDLVKPVKESLEKVDCQIREIEGARREAYGTLSEQVRALLGSQESLRLETGKLIKALRVPAVRGRWGEMQLRRVVEIAGMVEYCDFDQQQTLADDGETMRPDLIVRLPGGKNVVVDAKAPLMAYLEALDSSGDEERTAALKEHARQIRSHLIKLSGKAYWDVCPETPEFVVMFLPGEMFFSAALQQDPELIEEGAARRVIPATPTTLIALLKSVAYGWREQRIAENARKISVSAEELHERLATMVEHLARLGASLSRSVDAFNEAVGSFEGRVLPSARRFRELGAASKKEIEELVPVEKNPRAVIAAPGDGNGSSEPRLQ